jgi:hypothetical protein
MTANKSRIEAILAEMPEADRAKAVKHLANLELALERQRLLGILGPYIRQMIRQEINNPSQLNGNING